MTVTSAVEDPLAIFPPEIVLRILDFTPVSTLASLTATSTAWHEFIDVTHREAIYSSDSKTSHPPGTTRDLSFLSSAGSFSKSFEGTTSWKDLCKRQKILARNWADSCPITQETVLQVGNDPVWRFRPDFKRRFFVSTSHSGGLNVTDMDSGCILWRLPSTLDRGGNAVRPYAHLEYQDGMAVFDREGDAVEVWQADVDDAPRGEFRRIAVLNHECQTRGFQLSYDTLCVVSNEGQGFVYDMKQRPPHLVTHLKIEPNAVGHLDQNKDVVIYSVGARGYHIYDKASGNYLGALHPSCTTNKYHIRPPPSSSRSASAALAGARHGPNHRALPSGPPRKDCLTPLKILTGPLSPPPSDPEHVWHGEDEWGAGMLDGDLFVGFSRAGRVFICSDWRKAIQDENGFTANTSIIECETDGSSFDLGGWLSVRNHRVMFEIQDRVYVVALDDRNKIPTGDPPCRASYALLTSSAPQLAVPVSFMTLCDDAIMTTFTTLGWRQTLSNIPGDVSRQQHESPARIFPTKAVRIISLSPHLASNPASPSSSTPEQSTEGDDEPHPHPDDLWRSQAGLLELINMLQDEFDEDDDPPDMFSVEGNHPIDAEWEDIDDQDEGGPDDPGGAHEA
ncbi:hypothetical protein N7520_005970 [Penicillium odoratum]|uniref:uncharacterized protein n=1 Tax=Penicillium odoratum TaxID=1167516 RepID=UPI002547AEA2|nr:uncharacterized protein N7520_005970 [Penicillium odoratum]KAJ5758814.1 hypothetical protein N7520_005970 [Penicillium odoratum]